MTLGASLAMTARGPWHDHLVEPGFEWGEIVSLYINTLAHERTDIRRSLGDPVNIVGEWAFCHLGGISASEACYDAKDNGATIEGPNVASARSPQIAANRAFVTRLRIQRRRAAAATRRR